MAQPNARYIVGIDLGTTNTALGFVDTSTLAEDKPVETQVFDIPQLTAPGTVLARPTLPSFTYLADAAELPAGALDLPWAKGRTFMVGTAAHERGAEVPLRLVGSAKSWLSHRAVDRRANILPHQAPEGVQKISPVAASTLYLEHVRDAWNASRPEKLETQHVLLTVPASFDAAARDLTIEAAQKAGFSDVTLLEEPQAAFYAWLSRIGDKWRKQLKAGDRVLVCDVGGGTTDFSLIDVRDDAGNLALERVAVGDHLLLGGDNMDLLLAHHLSEKLAKDGKKLDAGQQRALVLAAKRAKEQLLGDPTLAAAPVTILGRGSKLIGGKIKVDLERADIERLLIEGFFPRVSREEKPERARRAGFMELGLPFVSDTAITRHLAHFLATHGKGELPTHVLFNGGVFNSPLLRSRLVEVIGSWSGGRDAPRVLEGADYDLAVARGASYYGAVQQGRGIRIRGGTARSYYIGIETSAPAIPGVAPPIRALCVVPYGMEEGTEARVPGGELGLVVGEPVEFRFLSSTTRKDPIGFVLDEYSWPEHLTEGSPLVSMMEADGIEPGTLVPVRLHVKLTEIGTLELWSVATDDSRRWRLELNVREQKET
ncbi:Hsp70 family protein [Myxococcota bacterium]|nr:Hsp70 family protein [Myxococcota bacterium]